MIIAHGWPGSVLEEIKLIGPLTDPTAYGGKVEDAFDVVIPSMPGYGFSGKPTSAGWGPERIAQAWAELMKRLGYTRYVAQGGDWGAVVVDLMGVQAPQGLLAIHTNMPGAVPPELDKAAFSGAPPPSDLSAEERHAYDQLTFFYTKDLAYAQEMGTCPQTLYGIADLPVGLAAWILDHDIRSYEFIARVFDGQPEGLTRDDILDNITLYLVDKYGDLLGSSLLGKQVLLFRAEERHYPGCRQRLPRRTLSEPAQLGERAYPKLFHYNKLDKGGHFAAWEQPALITAELRTALRSLH